MRYLALRSLKQPWNNHRRSLIFTFQRYSTSSKAPAAPDTNDRPVRRVKRRLSTLDPVKLTPHDWVDLGGQKTISVRWGNNTQSLPLHYQYNLGCAIPWPSFAKGFLYFHRPALSSTMTKAHPASGSLRLRFAESPSDLTHAFSDQGKDVTVDAGGGTPWSISFLTLLRMSYYAPVRPQLYSDGFVTSKSAAEIDRLLEGFAIKRENHGGDGSDSSIPWRRLNASLGKRMRVLEDVTQPWTLDLDIHGVLFLVLAEDKIYSVFLRDVTMTEPGRRRAAGRQGVALVRFELDGRKRLVLRLLRYIVPPDLGITAQNLGQTEGQLVQQYLRHCSGQWLPPKTWSADPASMLSPASYAVLAKMYS
ncbi:hypothetical protein BKA70DRAFT_1314951 [Coprinopsis sp. MPI-PUGE-AT-0042]|nr:hypothetical protein BKA70DRAFT_1314951 [Coprinopsis sp. MPI-PUGE-AT-0042]